jgi:hypothetical protein
MWFGLTGLVVLIGLTGVSRMPLPAGASVLAAGAILAAAPSVAIRLHRNTPTLIWSDSVVILKQCAIGGIVALSFSGLLVALDSWAIVVASAIATSHPGVRAHLSRRFRAEATPTFAIHEGEEQRPGDLSSEDSWRSIAMDVTRGMTDTDLCQGWRSSFTLLNDVPQEQRARIVEARQYYLDELDRRHRDEFMAWLASGARAAGNPSRFILGSASLCQPPIDWDQLLAPPTKG